MYIYVRTDESGVLHPSDWFSAELLAKVVCFGDEAAGGKCPVGLHLAASDADPRDSQDKSTMEGGGGGGNSVYGPIWE